MKIVGLMSGTSHDGVDSALVEIDSPSEEPDNIHVRLINHVHISYPASLRNEIRQAFSGDTGLLCRLNFRLGEVFAHTVLALLERSGLRPCDIDAVASHGQTVYHIPPVRKSRKGRITGSTFQIGEGAVIAELTGILTITDFRTADMAAGGNGAPLVPLTDYLLFRKPGEVIAILNIGGIANVTIVKERKEDTVAYDIGPGNALIDEAILYVSRGKKSFDKNGDLARSGKVADILLHELKKHPYLRKRPPKSTGRESFGAEMVRDIFRRYRNLPHQDIVATLTYFTATVIHKEIVKYKPYELIISGGGVFNRYLVETIEKMLGPEGIKVSSIEAYGFHPQAKEAVSFAILGYRTLNHLPGNIPAVTGASREVILGKISRPAKR